MTDQNADDLCPVAASVRSGAVSWAPADSCCELVSTEYGDHSFAPHVHSTYAIGVITSGRAATRYRGARNVVAPGWVITLDPNELHTGEPAGDEGWASRMFYPSLDLMQAVGAGIGSGVVPRFGQAAVADPELATMLATAHRAIERDGDPLACESLLLESLTMLVIRHGGAMHSLADTGSARVARHAREYIDARRGAHIVLQELAATLGIGIFSLTRSFRRAYGIPPYLYAESVRIEHARELLRGGEGISAVAYKAGFSDQSHLTRQFKRIVGITPGRYASGVRNSHRNARMGLAQA